MSATKHTPGPWKTRAGLFVTANNDAMRICKIRGWGYLMRRAGGLDLLTVDAMDEAVAVLMANARLIAAAPMMLDLLTRLRAWDDLPGRADGSYWIAEIDAVLAKAEWGA